MTILICGASGLVGREMSLLLKEKEIPFIGTYHLNKMEGSNMFRIDFLNESEVAGFLKDQSVTVCVFCIVERLVDVCENEWNRIKDTNIQMVHITSYLCNQMGIQFIHLSTDYVFDGLQVPNYPDSIVNPLQNYGISKLISEHRVLRNCKDRCIIIRTPVLYSALSKLTDNAVTLIGKNCMDLRSDVCHKEDHYCIRRPLYIPDLCQFIYDCCMDSSSYSGIYHFYNPYHQFTKYEISGMISDILGVPHRIAANTGFSGSLISPRPYDTQLADLRLSIDNYSFTDFEISLKTCFERFELPCFESSSIFFMIDLDGTLIDSSMAHYRAYLSVYNSFEGIKNCSEFISFSEWTSIVNNNGVDDYLQEVFGEDVIKEIKARKFEALKKEPISFIGNSDMFLECLINNGFNFCIVTNTGRKTVKLFQEKLPLLKNVSRIICREDYSVGKPDPECYQLAKDCFYRSEDYIIGFEDSLAGYRAISSITPLVFIYNSMEIFKKENCYLFNDYKDLLTI
jgi:dTDP-4-dehydrorhamnose reductase